jgi:hypothetical protein
MTVLMAFNRCGSGVHFPKIYNNGAIECSPLGKDEQSALLRMTNFVKSIPKNVSLLEVAELLCSESNVEKIFPESIEQGCDPNFAHNVLADLKQRNDFWKN